MTRDDQKKINTFSILTSRLQELERQLTVKSVCLHYSRARRHNEWTLTAATTAHTQHIHRNKSKTWRMQKRTL